MTPQRLAAVLILGASAACTLHAMGCKGDGTHVYQGRLYVEARDCLGTLSSVDVVGGDETGECAPVCMVQPRAEGGRAVYVATQCPPYPQPDFDFSGTDPACAKALAALTRDDTCVSDGGTTHPAPADASAD
ncbi:MAG: hypothetical protein JWP97_1380 [Labilithrix sp.]|nr:hypothetical protein [Labilithrix sp.]